MGVASLHFLSTMSLGWVNCLWSRCLMCLSMLFSCAPGLFVWHLWFLTGEYSYSSWSSLASNNVIRLLTGPTFIFECFHIRRLQHVVPFCQSSGNLSPQAMNSNLQARMRTWPIGGPCMDLLCVFECIGYWDTGKSPPLCMMDGMLCIILVH